MAIIQPSKVVTFTGFNYTAGQGGTPLYAENFTDVQNAAVVGINGQFAGSLALFGDVKGVNINSATVATGTLPTSNEVLLFLYNNVAGTVTEISTGTVSATIFVSIEGH